MCVRKGRLSGRSSDVEVVVRQINGDDGVSVCCGCGREIRRGEERGRRGDEGWWCVPAGCAVKGEGMSELPLLSLFSSSLLISLPPTTHTHTITCTDLAHNHLHITAPLTQPTSPHTHTHVPILTQCMCQCTEETQQQQQQQPHYSCSSPPPPAHVLLHLHATHVNTSSKWYMCE